MKTGEYIKEFRQKSKLTQKQLAEKIGLSQHAISKYEQDQRQPNLNTLKEIAKALNVSIADLVDEETKQTGEFLFGSIDTYLLNSVDEKELNARKNELIDKYIGKHISGTTAALYIDLLARLQRSRMFTPLDRLYDELDKITKEDFEIIVDTIETVALGCLYQVQDKNLASRR